MLIFTETRGIERESRQARERERKGKGAAIVTSPLTPSTQDNKGAGQKHERYAVRKKAADKGESSSKQRRGRREAHTKDMRTLDIT